MPYSVVSLCQGLRGECRIAWDACDPDAWDARFAAISRSSLLQSRPYGEAAAFLAGQTLRRGLIYRGGEAAGLVQIQEAGVLRNAVHAVILDRGPLWFDGFGGEEDFRAFLGAFLKDYPRRFGRRMRIIPEIAASEGAHEALTQAGFRRRSRAGYQTIWLDLRPPLPILRKNLKYNWRYALKRAENNGLTVHWGGREDFFPMILKAYHTDRIRKGYEGASPEFLDALARKFNRGQNMLAGYAALDGKAVAGTIIFCHGASATWQAGWVSEAGRKNRANHLLLWESFRILKERGINDFDLGGVNDESARGVKTFKSGMGGKMVESPGLYV